MTAKQESIQLPTRKKKKIPISHAKTKQQQQLFFGVSGLLFVISLLVVDIDWKQFVTGVEKLPATLSNMMQISTAMLPDYLREMLASLAVALLALIFGLVLSIMTAFLVARNITPSMMLSRIIRFSIMIIRAVPTTVWVLIAVASIGFGYTAGILGLILPTAAYLIRTFAAQIEEVGDDTIEALRSVGACWILIIFKGLLPKLKTIFIATIAFKFEMNVSESVVLGMVGAGGVGMLIQDSIAYYNFGDMTLGILIVFVTMFTIETCTGLLRKKLR
ncbi:ABC transporter permease subunit [Lysinibacillus agricola]|uniref:ABC transporter permease subunit n=1 Tax=Lysinibacillus agricola TaxID=2590012 RepID=A0ABX7AL11_9BACI|nr:MULTISPECIES: ABC transporter permease subunit [Lysinibacillus]KOS63667.1 ABC transporter permease [Lysinibacillus sp. FJAT-14222]QQP10530.1 ABC transporter permease subunit [Lysinibacillus agricola]